MRLVAHIGTRVISARLLLPLIALLALMLQAGAHSPGVRDEDQAAAHEVEAFREFIRRSIEKRDARAVRKIYADSFTHTDEKGRIRGKEAVISAVLAGEETVETAPAEDLLFRVFGDHTIIVTGRSPVRGKSGEQAYQVSWVAVYVKSAGDWRFAASQVTRVP